MRFIRPSRSTIVAALAVATLALLASSGQAQDCAGDCGLHRRACMREARTAMGDCSAQCREQADGAAACMRSCVGSFLDTKQTCRGELVSCLGACGPQTSPGEPSGCRTGCGSTLSSCAKDVQIAGRECLRGCADAADHAGCVSACGGEARGGAARCRAGLQTCLSGCAMPPVRPTSLGR